MRRVIYFDTIILCNVCYSIDVVSLSRYHKTTDVPGSNPLAAAVCALRQGTLSSFLPNPSPEEGT